MTQDEAITGRDLAARVAALPWREIEAALDARGSATTGPLLTAAECRALAGLWACEERFRRRVVMARH
ncbi:MAG: proline hydroxylase, partial [Rhodospirillaceae bacterium]|nr:proline hydroxylase [Rhodospirillaceae bacterium]